MKRRRLDQSKSLGTVSPAFFGATAYQDGVYFDPSGMELFTAADDTDEKREASLKRWADQESKAANMRQAKAKKASSGAPDPEDGSGDDPEEDQEGEPNAGGAGAGETGVDLAAWAKGEAKYPSFQVFAKIKETYSRVVSNKTDAVDTLIEKGVVKADDVKV